MTQDEIKLTERFLSKESLSQEALNAFDKLLASYRILSLTVDELADRFEHAR